MKTGRSLCLVVFCSLVMAALLLRPVMARAQGDWEKVDDKTASTPAAAGEPERETRSQVFRKPGLGIKDGAWALMLGPQIGWAVERQAKQETGNADKDGYFFAGKAFASRFTDRYIFDVGLGWQYTALDGHENVQENGIYVKKLVTIESQAFSLDAGADYRFSRFWSAGLALSHLWGDDLSFGSKKGNVTSALIGGINIAYTDLRDDGLFRYRLQALTDVNIPKRSVYWVSLGVEIGIPLTTYDRERRVEAVNLTTHRTEEVVVEKAVPVAQSVRVLSTPLDPALVAFDEKTGQLNPKAVPFLRDLCLMVQRTADNYEYAEMQYVMPSEGLGSGDQNHAAMRSADLVKHCHTAGVPASKIRGEGLLVTPMPGERVVPYVNLRFYRLNDEDALKRDIVDLQKRYRQPETCRNGTCR